MPKRDPQSTASNSESAGPSVHSADERNDIANAERFVAICRGRVLFCAAWKQWLVWDETRWNRDANGQVMELAKETAKALLADAKFGGDETRAIAFARSSKNRRSLENMLVLAQSDPRLAATPEQFDCNDWLLNCPNGTVDLRTGVLRDHDPSDFITRLCPTSFDPSASADTWLEFLNRIQQRPEVVAWLQMYFGYCLTGQVSERTLLIFWGAGANGKSKLIEAISEVFGSDYASKVATDVVVADPRDRHSTGLTELNGRRLVYCNETRQGEKLDEAKLKDITDGSHITARKVHRDYVTFPNTTKLIFCTNFKPKLTPDDEAVWSRVVLVPFESRFHDPDKGEIGPEDMRMDKSMPDRLRTEAAGILAWMIEGCLTWQNAGEMPVPDSIRKATHGFRAEADPFTEFVRLWCECGYPEYSESAASMLSAYESFCRTNGYPAPTQKNFGDRLSRFGVERFSNSQDGKRIWYRRIRLRLPPVPRRG